MTATTDFLDLNLPTVGGDQDTWGDELNANITTEDETFRALVEEGNYGSASGVDTITVSLPVVPKTLRTGLEVAFKTAGANTTTPTLNVNSLGAKSIKFTDGSSLAAGDLASGAVYVVRYDGADFVLNGVGVATATEVAGILSTKAVTPKAAAFTTSGGIYERAIGGVYEKWGTASVTSNVGGVTTGAASISFPTAFPTACDQVFVAITHPTGGLANVIYSAWHGTATTAGVSVGITRAGVGSDGPFNVDWYAKGR